MSISINVRIRKNLNDLIERCESHDDDDDDDDESDKHLEARDRRYSYLKFHEINGYTACSRICKRLESRFHEILFPYSFSILLMCELWKNEEFTLTKNISSNQLFRVCCI